MIRYGTPCPCCGLQPDGSYKTVNNPPLDPAQVAEWEVIAGVWTEDIGPITKTDWIEEGF